jgi:hypothetical protein
MADGKELGFGKIVVSLGGMHSRVIESPQFGLILAKGRDQDLGRLHKIANYKSLFCNLEFLEFLGEIGFL